MRVLALVSIIIVSCAFIMESCYSLTPTARLKDFVYLHEIDPTILVSIRYATTENFVGLPIDGYINNKNVAIMTTQTARALQRVQEQIKKDGYCLVVYDAYRPQCAVDHFVRWAAEDQNQLKKNFYYPRVDKTKLFELGYIGKRSGHSRGSTVDVTFIKKGKKVHTIKKRKRQLLDGYTIAFLDDGTIDMGSYFDLFDNVSHYETNLISTVCKKRRMYLKQVMEKHGFISYEKEWWHFTFKDELYPAHQERSYFNFPAE